MNHYKYDTNINPKSFLIENIGINRGILNFDHRSI